MLKKLFGTDTAALDEQIASVLSEMSMKGVTHPEYPAFVERLAALNEIKTSSGRKRVSADTLVIAGVNLLGIILLMTYENKHVFTSRTAVSRIRPMQ